MRAGVNAAIRAYVDANPSEDTCSAVVRVVSGLRDDLAKEVEANEVQGEETRREYLGRIRAEAERDEMRDARDRLIAENDRLRARLADVESRAEGLDVRRSRSTPTT